MERLQSLPVVTWNSPDFQSVYTIPLLACISLKHALDIGLMESQCKIRRKVKIRQGERIVLFDSMADCAAYFGFKKGWLQNQIRKHGCIFNYLGWEIEVYGRGIDL